MPLCSFPAESTPTQGKVVLRMGTALPHWLQPWGTCGWPACFCSPWQQALPLHRFCQSCCEHSSNIFISLFTAYNKLDPLQPCRNNAEGWEASTCLSSTTNSLLSSLSKTILVPCPRSWVNTTISSFWKQVWGFTDVRHGIKIKQHCLKEWRVLHLPAVCGIWPLNIWVNSPIKFSIRHA